MKHVRKWLPVPTYDLPGMEGWLEEMAGKGLYLAFPPSALLRP